MNALVAQPGLVDAAVLYATTSSLAAENWRQFGRDGDDQRTNRRMARTLRAARRQPEVLAGRLTPAVPRPDHQPVLLHHGTADDTCPPRWARSVTQALKAARKDVTLRWYEGQGHRMEGAAFARSIDRTADFFSENLK